MYAYLGFIGAVVIFRFFVNNFDGGSSRSFSIRGDLGGLVRKGTRKLIIVVMGDDNE